MYTLRILALVRYIIRSTVLGGADVQLRGQAPGLGRGLASFPGGVRAGENTNPALKTTFQGCFGSREGRGRAVVTALTGDGVPLAHNNAEAPPRAVRPSRRAPHRVRPLFYRDHHELRFFPALHLSSFSSSSVRGSVACSVASAVSRKSSARLRHDALQPTRTLEWRGATSTVPGR